MLSSVLVSASKGPAGQNCQAQGLAY